MPGAPIYMPMLLDVGDFDDGGGGAELEGGVVVEDVGAGFEEGFGGFAVDGA